LSFKAAIKWRPCSVQWWSRIRDYLGVKNVTLGFLFLQVGEFFPLRLVDRSIEKVTFE